MMRSIGCGSPLYGCFTLGVLALDLASVQFIWMPAIVPQTLTAIFVGAFVWGIASSWLIPEEEQEN